jgi:spermidine/putrescine-binding protein
MTTRRHFLAFAPGLAACAPRKPRLNVFNWSNYMDPAVLAEFEALSNVTVRYAVYESNEELLARILSGNSGWDVAFPSHYFIEPMRQLNLLAPLDHSLLSNLHHLDPLFRRPVWDPRLQWGVPYMWGNCGILYDSRLPSPPRRWADMWDPRFAGRITMLDDPGEVIGAALLKLGLPLNSTSPEELARAKREALAQKPLLRAYLNAEVRDQAVSGDVIACQLWATTAQQAIDAAPHLAYGYPGEGFSVYADCAIILRESRRHELAHQFIDFLLRPENAARIVTQSRTATANGDARALLPPSVSQLQSLYPHPDTLTRGQWFLPMPSPAQRLRDRLWTEIKSA